MATQPSIMTGLFRDRDSAERAYGKTPLSRGDGRDDVSLLMSEETRKRHFNDPDAARTDLGHQGGSRCRSRGRGWWWAGGVTGGPRRGGHSSARLADHRDGDVRRGTDGRRYRRSDRGADRWPHRVPGIPEERARCMTAGFATAASLWTSLHDRLRMPRTSSKSGPAAAVSRFTARGSAGATPPDAARRTEGTMRGRGLFAMTMGLLMLGTTTAAAQAPMAAGDTRRHTMRVAR